MNPSATASPKALRPPMPWWRRVLTKLSRQPLCSVCKHCVFLGRFGACQACGFRTYPSATAVANLWLVLLVSINHVQAKRGRVCCPTCGTGAWDVEQNRCLDCRMDAGTIALLGLPVGCLECGALYGQPCDAGLHS